MCVKIGENVLLSGESRPDFHLPEQKLHYGSDYVFLIVFTLKLRNPLTARVERPAKMTGVHLICLNQQADGSSDNRIL